MKHLENKQMKQGAESSKHSGSCEFHELHMSNLISKWRMFESSYETIEMNFEYT